MIQKIFIITTLLVIIQQTLSQCPFSKIETGTCPFSNKPKTVQGCKCISNCQASPSVGNSQCDFCKTLNCGSTTDTGTIDSCIYPPNKEYESITAEQKLAFLWNNCEKDKNIAGEENGEKLFTMSMHTSFDAHSDTLPEGRDKVIRAVGSVCKFSFSVDPESPFTGVFEAGAESVGIIRLSWPPFTEKTGLVPGVGVKFLRSKVHSANFVAVNSFDPIPNNSFNWFQEPLRNKFPLNKKKARVIEKFREASQCPYFVGLSDICKFKIDGTKVEKPVFPFEIELVASEINFPTTPINGMQLFQQLESIPVGSSIYDINAYQTPQDKAEGNAIYLGSMITTSQCISSAFGDTKLFFRHQRVEEDWQLRPEWIDSVDPRGDCNTSELTNRLLKTCPSNKSGMFTF